MQGEKGIAAEARVCFKLLSLQDKAALVIENIKVAYFSLSSSSSSPLDGMDSIRELLQEYTASTSSIDNDDPKRALVDAIAKAALRGKAAPTAPSIVGGGGELLNQVVTLLQQQQDRISQLEAAVNRLEGICADSREILLELKMKKKKEPPPEK